VQAAARRVTSALDSDLLSPAVCPSSWCPAHGAHPLLSCCHGPLSVVSHGVLHMLPFIYCHAAMLSWPSTHCCHQRVSNSLACSSLLFGLCFTPRSVYSSCSSSTARQYAPSSTRYVVGTLREAAYGSSVKVVECELACQTVHVVVTKLECLFWF
jgi:hypothetical protein